MICRRVIGEQHLSINAHRPGYVGNICTDMDVLEAVDFASQKATQVCMYVCERSCVSVSMCQRVRVFIVLWSINEMHWTRKTSVV